MHETLTHEKDIKARNLLSETHDKLAARFNSLWHDPDLHDLMRGVAADTAYGEISDEDLADEQRFTQIIEEVFNFRQGKSRLEQQAEGSKITLSDKTKIAAEKVIQKRDMRKTTHPSRDRCGIVLVAGAAGATPARRLEHVSDVESQVLVMIGSERPVDEAERGRAGKYGYSYSTYETDNKKPATTEFELMLNTAAHKYEIADSEWIYEGEGFEGIDPRVPNDSDSEHTFASEYRTAYAIKDGKLIVIMSVPMIDEERVNPDGSLRNKANSIDGFRAAAELLDPYFEEARLAQEAIIKGNGEVDPTPLLEEIEQPQKTAIVSTDAAFVPFQSADAESALAQYGINCETVGINREDAGLDDWPLGIQFYIQEILSEVRSTRLGRDRLEDEGKAIQLTQ